MKLYEVEVVTKITIRGVDEREAKTRAVAWVKEKTHADEAAWLSCKERSESNEK